MPAPSDREYWGQRNSDLNYLGSQMNRLKPSDPNYQELDRQRIAIMDEADAAGVYLPDYK